MLNTIRADFFRLKHSRGFWIAQLLLISFTIISIKFQQIGQVGIIDESLPDYPEITAWTGTSGLLSMISMISLIMYFILPIIVIIVGHDLSKQTYKNSLTVGVSRIKYFLSKLLTVGYVTLLQLGYYYLVSFITSSLLYGVGTDFNSHFIQLVLKVFIFQFLATFAILAVGLLVLFTTSNSIAMILTVLIFPMLVSLMSIFFPKIEALNYLNFQTNADMFSVIAESSEPLLPYFATPVVFIIGICLITSLLFKKREL